MKVFGHLPDSLSLPIFFLGLCAHTYLPCSQNAHGPLWPSMAFCLFILHLLSLLVVTFFLCSYTLPEITSSTDMSSSVLYSTRFSVQMDWTKFLAMIIKVYYFLLLHFCTWKNFLTFLPVHLTTGYFLQSPAVLQLFFYSYCLFAEIHSYDFFFIWFLDSFLVLNYKRIKKLFWQRQNSVEGKELRGQ